MYNIIELFSGIGSQAKALKNLGIEINTVGTCEWDIRAAIAYDAIHSSVNVPNEYILLSKEELLKRLEGMVLSNDGKEPADPDSIAKLPVNVLRRLVVAVERNHNYVDVSSLHGDRLPGNVDIMTYSFPCQDLSNVGAFHGYNKGIDPDSGSRSSLLWQVGRILGEMQNAEIPLPRYLVMENVPALLSERHKGNFEKWQVLLADLGYTNVCFQLNAKDFGIPQNRPRLIMISVYTASDEVIQKVTESTLCSKTADGLVEDYRNSDYFSQKTVSELLRIDYENEKLFQEACECCPADTVSRRKIWDENPQIVLEGNRINPDITFIRTLTTKQDRNPNSGNLAFESGINGRSSFRYLTPRECMLFMGNTDEDYERLMENNPEVRKDTVLFPRDKIIRMAGNSIPVKMLEGVFLQIINLDKRIEQARNGQTY